MKQLNQSGDNDIFGPGTDLIVSLTAVLILLFAVNSNLFRQKMQFTKKLHDIEVDHLIEAYNDIGNRLKEIEGLPESHTKIEEVVKINQELYEKLNTAIKDKAEVLKRFESFMSSYQNRKNRFLKSGENSLGNLDLRKVQQNQVDIVYQIGRLYQTLPKEKENDTYVISIDENGSEDIVVHNEVTLQTFTFGNHILFDMDEVELKPNGREILKTVGAIFKGKLGAIREIQIQGHADLQQSKKYSSNLQLAANRAITVFDYLQHTIGIDPAQNVMSVTSFGEYMPIARPPFDQTYSRLKLAQANDTKEKRGRNRRIEIVLFYKFYLS